MTHGDTAPERAASGREDELTQLRQRVAALEAELSAVQQSDRLHRALLDALPIPLYRLDPAGRFQYANPTLQALLGLSPAEILGRPVSDFLPDDLAERVQAEQQQVLQTGQPVLVRERACVTRTGRSFIVDSFKLPLHDGAGRVTGIQGVLFDVTPRVQTEHALRQSEARLAEAHHVAQLGAWEWQVGAEEVWFSDELWRICGREPQAFRLTLDSCLQLAHPDDRALIQQKMQESTSPNGPAPYEHRILRPSGEVRWLRVLGQLERDTTGRPIRMFGTSQDITDQKQAEEERERLEARLRETQKQESLGILAGGIAHDFNNLLTVILGNASLVEGDLPPESPFRPLIEQVVSASWRAADLCKQMLAYAGRGQMVISRVDVNALVREMVGLLRASVSGTIQFQLTLAESLPALLADASQIRQIILNLVVNATEAIGEQPGEVGITTGVMHADRQVLAGMYLAPELAEADYLFLEVSDTGCGMDQATLHRIFDPFFTTKFLGRGLGLPAVIGIVRSHQGAIRVESQLGQGATFRVLLPPAPASSPT